MRSYGLAALILSSSSAFVLAALGCSSGADTGPDEATATANATGSESDLALAKKAVALINGDNGKCTACHTAGKTDLKRWGDAFTAVDEACFGAAAAALTPVQKIDCLRKDPANPSSPFAASKLGLYAAGASGADFEALFKAAYGADQYVQKFKDFKTKAAMPAFNRPGLTADQFATVKKWAQRGLPNLDDVIQDQPGQTECTFNVSPELSAHIQQMKSDGWGARLAAASTPMAGCGGASTDPTQCLTSFPDITAQWGVEGTTQKLRELRKLTFTSDFWVRSSPDGRFTSFGSSPSKIVDNANPSATPVDVDAPYDPGYFPDNSGFSFAGTNGGITACKQSVLLNAFQTHRKITFNEAGCSGIIDTVYQSVGASLDGSLYFMATGDHTDDSGDNDGPLDASFGSSSATTLTPMFNGSTKYVAGDDIKVAVPNEGDQQLSPSNTLLITRFGSDAGKAGYNFRLLTPHVTAPASGSPASATPHVTVDAKVVGTACLAGGKPQLSFDERFLAVHQYTDKNANPAHLADNSSNIFLVDLVTGKTTRLTTMKAGQHALYPHWRADGWLYFLVRDGNSGKETLVASDAALHQN